jgi:DNA polymerase beta
MKNPFLGVHINDDHFKNLIDALHIVKKLNVNVLQIYLGDKRHTTLTKKMTFTKLEIKTIKLFLKNNNIKLFIHSILSLNYCKDPTSLRYKWGIDNLIYDMKVGKEIGASGVVIHMGTHKTEKINLSYEECQKNFIKSLKMVLDETKKIPIILETPVNRKYILGGTIEKLADLYNNIPDKYRKRVKICIDTQHIFVSGYNLRNLNIAKMYFEQIKRLICLKNIALIHLNDSEKEFNSKINRHQTTQKGFIFSNGGKPSLAFILQFAHSNNIPISLETKFIHYKSELNNLKKLYNFKFNNNLLKSNIKIKNKKIGGKNKKIGDKNKKKDLKPLLLKIFNKILKFHMTLGKKGNISTKFRIDSYRKVIKSIENYNKPIYSSSNIKELNGIGKGFIEKINEINKTGSLKIYENIIKNKSTNALYTFQQIWGVGPVIAKDIVNKKIYTINNLKKSVKNKKIDLTEQQLIGLKYYEQLKKKIPRSEIKEFTQKIEKIIKTKLKNVKIYNAGSYRTGKKESGDIDLILTFDKSLYLQNEIQKYFYDILIKKNIILNTLIKGNEKSIYIVKSNKNIRQMDIAFIEKKYLPWYLLYFGSSREFSKKIRNIVSKMGYKLNEKGLFNKKTGKKIKFEPKTEKDIFNFLKINYVKPENRV